MLALEYRAYQVVGGGVLVIRTQPVCFQLFVFNNICIYLCKFDLIYIGVNLIILNKLWYYSINLVW